MIRAKALWLHDNLQSVHIVYQYHRPVRESESKRVRVRERE